MLSFSAPHCMPCCSSFCWSVVSSKLHHVVLGMCPVSSCMCVATLCAIYIRNLYWHVRVRVSFHGQSLPSVCLASCLPACLSACLPVCLPVCLSVCLSVWLSVSVSSYLLSLSLSRSLCVCSSYSYTRAAYVYDLFFACTSFGP